MRSKALPGWAHTLCTAAAALVFLLAYELVVYRVPVTEIFLPVSSWSDEVIYSKQLSAAVQYGAPQGYFGFNESHAAVGTYAAWGPAVFLVYALPGLLLRGQNAFLWCNLLFVVLGWTFFARAARLGWKRQLAFAAALAAMNAPIRYVFSAMQEPLHYALVLAVLGLLLWLVYMGTPFAGKGAGKKEVTDWSFLRSTRFWLLTGLLFCQNAAEQSVTGWMVTYFKGSGIIAGALAAYTVTVMWGATLVARLLIAFVFPFKQPRKAMVVMGVSCTIFYILLVQARSQGAAIVLLFAFAFAMAGMNPTAVASAGRMTSVTSMGIMLPVAASGAILMPWVIGVVAESAGLAAGMMTNIVPCVGLVIFAILVARLPEE